MTQQALSTTCRPRRGRPPGVAACVLGLAAWGGANGEEPTVTVTSSHANVVSYWNDVANRTVNAASATHTTAEEQRPAYHVDLATVHVAIYDAVSAIDGRFKPFAVTPASPSGGASIEAAATAAAYGVLRALFPNRGAQYQAAYDHRIASMPAGGGTAGTARTAGQFETARFHAEPPASFVTRNLGRFAASTADAAEAARLMAFIYVAHADAIGACFEAKYFHEAWRPQSAIPLADDDGNPATASVATWKPALPTPNHPEYPAAHSCTSGALGETLRQFYGTRRVIYTFDSAVTGTTRTYATTDALDDESRAARIYGGMHFDFATVAGVELGTRVAQWVAARHFGPKE